MAVSRSSHIFDWLRINNWFNVDGPSTIGGTDTNALKTWEDMDIYVSTAGSDVTGDGSVGNPYATRTHVYNNVLPDTINHNVMINIGAGTYYEAAILKGKLIGSEGYLKIKGNVAIIDDNGGANYTCNASSLRTDANGRGYWEVAGTPFTPAALAGKWLKVVHAQTATADIYEKYYPIKTNGNNSITTPIMAFNPADGITEFLIVEFDTVFSGADAVHTHAPQNIAETVDNMLTPTSSSGMDGLYVLAPLEYEAINVQESNGGGITSYNSNYTVQGLECSLYSGALATVDGNQVGVTSILVDSTAELVEGMGVVNIGNNSYSTIVSVDDATHFTVSTAITISNLDSVIYYPWAPGIYATGGIVKSYGLYTHENTPGQYTAARGAQISGVGVLGDGATKVTTGVTHFYGIQVLDNAYISALNYDIYGAGGNTINSPFYAYGAGSYLYIGSGRVDYATRVIRSGGEGFAREIYTDGIYGANVTNHAQAEGGGTISVADQASLTLTSIEYVVDDTALIYYYTNGQYLTMNSDIEDDPITAVTDTINSNRKKIRLTADAAYTMTSTPTIVAGEFEGQIITLIGTSGVNTITLRDNSVLATSLLSLINQRNMVLGDGDWIEFIWMDVGGTSMWQEVDRSDSGIFISNAATDTDSDNTDILSTGIADTEYGMVMVRETVGTEACMFLIAGGTIEKISGDATFTVTAGTGAAYNVYFAGNEVVVENLVGDNKNIRVAFYGM